MRRPRARARRARGGRVHTPARRAVRVGGCEDDLACLAPTSASASSLLVEITLPLSSVCFREHSLALKPRNAHGGSEPAHAHHAPHSRSLFAPHSLPRPFVGASNACTPPDADVPRRRLAHAAQLRPDAPVRHDAAIADAVRVRPLLPLASSLALTLQSGVHDPILSRHVSRRFRRWADLAWSPPPWGPGAADHRRPSARASTTIRDDTRRGVLALPVLLADALEKAKTGA
jgi:hypothetical protein